MADSWEGSKIDLEASWHWIDGSEFSLKVIAVMRPCDGTSGLVRGNRRKAVFAFKGLFSKGYLSRFRFGAVGFYRRFRKYGKIGNLRAQPDFLPINLQGTSARLRSGRQISAFHRTSGSVCFRHATSFGTLERNSFFVYKNRR